MQMTADALDAACAAIARALYDLLLDLDLKQAEEAIEDARKIVWVHHFSGAPRATAVALYARSLAATALSDGLDGRSLLEAETVLQKLRLAIYVNVYGAREHTRFGALMKATLKGAAEAEAGRLPQ